MTTSLASFARGLLSEHASSDLDVLEKLAGKNVSGLHFFETLDEAKRAIQPEYPLFMLPVGDLHGDAIGLHLRPEDVEMGRTAVLCITEVGNIEVGGSIADTIRVRLAATEARNTEVFQQGLQTVSAALGADFYVPGRLGDLTSANADSVAGAHWPSAMYFVTEAIGRPAERKREIYEEGLEKVPGMLFLRAALAELDDAVGRTDSAAGHAAAGLDCYHHTAYTKDLAKFYALASKLLASAPSAFTPKHREQLTRRSDKERLLLITETFQAGDIARSAKLLCDLANDLGFYNQDPMPMMFRKQFERLGWNWALELLSLR